MIGRFTFDRKTHHTVSTSKSRWIFWHPVHYIQCVCVFVLKQALEKTYKFLWVPMQKHSKTLHIFQYPSVLTSLAAFCLQLAPLSHFGIFPSYVICSICLSDFGLNCGLCLIKPWPWREHKSLQNNTRAESRNSLWSTFGSGDYTCLTSSRPNIT